MAGQSRLGSAIEAAVNVAVGYFVAVAANIAVLPFFGLPVSAGDALWIGAIFTVISLVRSYALRRVFNALWVRERNAPRSRAGPGDTKGD